MKRINSLFIISFFIIFLLSITTSNAQLIKSSIEDSPRYDSIYPSSFFLNNSWMSTSILSDLLDFPFQHPTFPIEQIKFSRGSVFDPFGINRSLNQNGVCFGPGFIDEKLHHHSINPFYFSILAWEYIWSLRNDLVTASDNSEDISIPHSMKGYELYSWPVESEWYFTLITGTNRLKTFDEITMTEDIIAENGRVNITVRGIESIKKMLDQLPKGEHVSWRGKEWLEQVQGETDYIALPDEEIINDIKMYCEQLNIDLHIAVGNSK